MNSANNAAGAQPVSHSLKDWIIATRPWSFPASLMPVAVTLTYLFWTNQQIDWTFGAWALVNIVLFHAAGNVWSDYFDFRKGVDNPESYCVKALVNNQFTPREFLTLAISLLTVAAVGGIALVALTGPTLLWIGLAGIITTLLYPTLKYRALGDLVIAIDYALLPMWGTSFVATGQLDPYVFLLAVPVGMITIAILHANNTRDILTDRRAKISTLAMRIGPRASAALYSFWILGAYAFTVACVAFGAFPLWSLLVLISLPQAIARVKLIMKSSDSVSIASLDELTAKLQLMFSVLLILSFIIAGVLS